MPRAIWTGTLSFGLVAIPVGVVTAVKIGRPSFHMLHDRDYSRLERRMVCPREDRVIHPEHVVKGYEIAPEKYVVVSMEEIEGLAPVRSQTIEIGDFVETGSVNEILYNRPYHLFPQKGGEKPYSLLAKALEETGKTGIASFVLRDREHLVAIRSIEGTLSMVTMHYFSEIVWPEETAAQAEASEEEVSTVQKIINSMEQEFDPSKYKNERIEKLMELIKEKAVKEGIKELPESDEEEGEDVDLIAALEESLGKGRSTKV